MKRISEPKGDKDIAKAAREFVKQVTPIVKRLQQSRDDLRDLLSDYNDILEQCDQGLVDIETGIDKISGLI